jgi:hypothetical protein
MAKAFDQLAMLLARGGSRRDALKYLGGLLTGGFLFGAAGLARADDGHHGHGDDDDDDDDDEKNEAINKACQKYCAKCPRKPHGIHGSCVRHCKRFLRRNAKGTLCGTCTAANPFTGCVAGATCCAATSTAAAFCTNTGTDVKNCGACGNACTGTTPACCSGKCADLASSATNCGACGTACTGATSTCCSGKCVDLTSDAKNCGKCGTACSGSTPNCKAGVCSA